ncbi:cold-shock protein [Actinoplanes awajinensis]|uniref:Cold-shock protein n=1 Tax=Actinoplanes awajinensis subsp. mycoplanecinus TaxID=135947 RepID=A0A0X3VAV4_9ACTN|nr:cold shock domain-containing protein [Actinoplanes awajinensis]KUL41939.1 cold-shock protein [Actinoplanes awajinensis subsp. mycoplanecinus]
MTSMGVVRSFDPDEGWGVIDGPDVPGGCWVHFSAIAVEGFRELTPGQQVSFRAEQGDQDGFDYRALKAWPGVGAEPPDQVATPHSPAAYQSTLTLTFDPSGDDHPVETRH